MKYPSGEQIHVNDNVLIENRRTSGVVEYIIETEADMNEWKVGEVGVLIQSAPFGLVFWPINRKDDPVVFLSRGNT